MRRLQLALATPFLLPEFIAFRIDSDLQGGTRQTTWAVWNGVMAKQNLIDCRCPCLHKQCRSSYASSGISDVLNKSANMCVLLGVL